MDEAQYLADRVAVIAAGRIVAEGSPDTLGNRDHARAHIRYRVPDGTRPPDELAGAADPSGFTEVTSADPVRDLHRLTGWALENGLELDGLEVTRPSLEDVYLSLTDESPSSRVASQGSGGHDGREVKA
jgi:ABC-2 type transport system ATP-binding protein